MLISYTINFIYLLEVVRQNTGDLAVYCRVELLVPTPLSPTTDTPSSEKRSLESPTCDNVKVVHLWEDMVV